MLHILTQALRGIRRRPATAVTATLTLAVGIGAATGVFSVVDAVLLASPPYADPHRLVLIQPAGDERQPLAPAPQAAAFAEARSLIGVGYVRDVRDGVLSGPDGGHAVRVGVVSAGLFHVLGVRPVAGRLLGANEAIAEDPEAPGPAPVLVSHGFWRTRLGGRSDVAGTTIRLDGAPATVAGVLPAEFRLLLPPGAGISAEADVWLPLRVPLATFRRVDRLRDQDSDNLGVVVARLRDGASLEAAGAELNAIAVREAVEWGAGSVGAAAVRAVPLHRAATDAVRPTLLVLMGAVLLVLLLTAANVAGLLLARTTRRRSEFAVRATLGAGRRALVTLVGAEAAVIGTVAGALGLLIGSWGRDLLLAFHPGAAAPAPGSALEPRVLGFAVAATLAAAVMAAVLPALRAARLNALPSLRGEAGAGDDGGPARARRLLVVAEIALSLALLVGAGLLVRTLTNLNAVDPGFDAEGVATFDLALVDPERYRGPGDRGAFVRALVDRLEALPSVGTTGVIGGLPLSGERFTQAWGYPGESPEAWAREANFRVISDGYLEAVGSRLVAGRAFIPADDRQDIRVALVDQALARRLAPEGDAVGRHIAIPLDGQPVVAEVVGVVESVRYDDLRQPGHETVYVPYRHEASRRVTVAVRTRGGAAGARQDIAATIAALDASLPLFGFRAMADHVRDATADIRFALLVLLGFAILAAGIAAVGVYAVIAHSVTSRTPELGVRLALGAEPAALVRMVLGDGVRLIVPGIAFGLVAAVVLARGATALLFGVKPLDPIVFATVTAVLVAAALAACWLPACRAARLDPATALRLR